MSNVLSLQSLTNCNILQKPTEKIGDYLSEHPNLYKVVLLVNHIFRAAAMATMNLCLPFSAPAKLAVCFAGSLFYRLTVETHCAFKFALPAFAGSLALPMGLKALSTLVSGVAFASLSALAVTALSLLPLVGYFVYIVLAVNDEVNKRIGV